MRDLNRPELVIKHIPFYEGDRVRDIVGGTLRGRGQRTGFEDPRSPYGYRYHRHSLAQSLPKHLSTEFTLYTCHHQGYVKIQTDYVGVDPSGKVRIRLKV